MTERTSLRIKLDSFRPLGEMVYESLRDAIANQVLKPGERLMEMDLADEMGVSRTPVREAIRKLELEGYVVMLPRKGAYVAGLSVKDINEVFEIRGALESLAAGLAAQRATDGEIEEMQRDLALEANHFETSDLLKTIEVDTRFHEMIFSAAKNNRLLAMVKELREQVQRFRTTTLAVPGRMKFALDEHREIVEAIASRDTEKAQRVAREHIESAEAALLEVISYQK
ncbi:MAG: GntR family transcriptional regulator [Clostridia bacterium]|jgi:DNA-binding GntR family transcriptional regulator|nr:GntR family transcriptional regulator [Clostridia bacterium]